MGSREGSPGGPGGRSDPGGGSGTGPEGAWAADAGSGEDGIPFYTYRRRWQSYFSLLEQTNPIHLAGRFLAELRCGSVRTYAYVAEHLDVSTAKVCYYTERRLRPVTRIKDEADQRARIADMIDEAREEAAVWGGERDEAPLAPAAE